MAKLEYFIDKQSMYEIGHLLWQMRQERHLYLRQVARKMRVPTEVIEGMEIGKFIKYGTLRRMIKFYGKNMRIVLE